MNTLNPIRKSFKNLLLVVIMLIGSTITNAYEGNESYSSLVIIKVQGLNTDSYNKIAAGINKEATMSLEYSCLESNVIVIKYKHTFNEKGDVQHAIKNKLKKWAGTTKVEFLHVDMVLSGVFKC